MNGYFYMTTKTNKFILITITLLFSTLACRAATNLISPDSPAPAPAPLPTKPVSAPTNVTEFQSCPVLLQDIMTAATTSGSDAEAQDDQYLVTYTVNGNQINNPQYETVPNDLQDKQKDNASHKFVWNYFASIIPMDERNFVTEYSITTDGVDNTLAAVTQTTSDPSHWALEVDILDINDTYNLTYTLIHEFGHLLTLNSEQVPANKRVFFNPDDYDIYDQAVAECPQYFTGEGCSTPDSYINEFFHRFWVDFYDEWKDIDGIEDEDVYYEKLDDFYNTYQDQFLTDYAPTNPGEDIAESWAFFILSPKPQPNSIANEKILFFYEYPELVQLREDILNRICESFPQ